MDQQSQSDALQAAIEREVRHLIGDLHMKVIALHTMLGMAQQRSNPRGTQPSEPKPQPTPRRDSGNRRQAATSRQARQRQHS